MYAIAAHDARRPRESVQARFATGTVASLLQVRKNGQMVLVSAYHRPPSAADALALLLRPGVRSALLGGGTTLNPALTDTQNQTRQPVEVIDLQQAGLSGIRREGAAVIIGATTTLQDVFTSTDVTEGLRELARREQPSTLRTLATIGGTIAAAHPESEFIAGLLALEATLVLLDASGTRSVPIAEVLTNPSALLASVIISVSFPHGGKMISARTTRTPMDRAIVCVVGYRTETGGVTLTATGIAPTATTLIAGAPVSPPGDFRGSSRYRTALLRTHAARVAEQLAN